MRVLIADDDPVSSKILKATLLSWGHQVVVACDGNEAWAVLQHPEAPPLAILDWMMPGLDGVEICRRLQQERNSSRIYSILLTAKSEKRELIEALESGADDYLIKPFDREELRARIKVGARIIDLQESLIERVRELEEAIIERKRAEEALRKLSLTDDLTGLYNRRGFFTFVEHFLKTASRTGQKSLLIYADMDRLKQINDTLGHSEGSLAIRRVSDALRHTFRESDIIARFGGDEFVILATNASVDDVEAISRRLEDSLQRYNSRPEQSYELSISFGVVEVDAQNGVSIDEMITEADKLMYEHKRNKKATLNPA